MGTTRIKGDTQLFIRRLRQQVDRLDDRLLTLLRQRIGITRELGRLKREIGKPLRDVEREQELLQRLMEEGGKTLPPEAVQRIFRSIVEVSLLDEADQE